MKKYLILSIALIFTFAANASNNYDDPPKSYQQAKQEMDDMCALEGKKATLKSASFTETTGNSTTDTRVGGYYDLGGNVHGEVSGSAGTKTNAEAKAGLEVDAKYNSSRKDKSETESVSFSRKYDFECE